MVDHHHLVRQEQHHVALLLGPHHMLLDRVELVGEVIAEGAVETERLVLAAEQIDDRAQHREDRRHARAFFLGIDARGLGDRDGETPSVATGGLDVGMATKIRLDRAEQQFAARVERVDLHLAAARGDGQRRIDDRGVPAGIAAGIFVVGGEDRAALAVQLFDIAGDRRVVGCAPALPGDGDAAFRLECLAHVLAHRPIVPSGSGFRPGEDSGHEKTARRFLGRSKFCRVCAQRHGHPQGSRHHQFLCAFMFMVGTLAAGVMLGKRRYGRWRHPAPPTTTADSGDPGLPLRGPQVDQC